MEGGDLTVRDQHVFIKTLQGLRRVDVILRRIDDTWCDPLELRSDSYLGVAGLVEAARAGTVAIVNPLGSGVVETPALAAFLPGLCQHLLGEELLLPSAATWWCGQPKEMDYVVSRMKDLVIKRAFPAGSGNPFFGRELDPELQEAMLAEIRQSPHGFVGQEQIPLSRAPVVQDGRLAPRSLVLRTFVTATPDGFHVMPGGLTRVAFQANGAVVSTQSGGSSKDTWVLTEGPVTTVTLLKPAPSVVRIERQPSEVPSRVADNLFWLGRYAERLEDTIRLLRVIVARLAGEGVAGAPPELAALLELLQTLGWVAPDGVQPKSFARIEKHLLLLIYKTNRTGGVRDVLNRLRHIAFAVRDRFTADTWRIFNKLQIDAQVRPGHLPVTESLALLNTLILDLSAFNGMAMENMTRGHGWLFLDIGRRIERALHMIALIRSTLLTDPTASLLLDPLLEISDSVMSYRRRYFARPQWSGVMDLIMLDETNPRSVAFQLASLEAHVDNLPVPSGESTFAREKLLILTAKEHLESGDLLSPELFADKTPHSSVLDFLQNLSYDLVQISEALTLHYFTHADSRPS